MRPGFWEAVGFQASRSGPTSWLGSTSTLGSLLMPGDPKEYAVNGMGILDVRLKTLGIPNMI